MIKIKNVSLVFDNTFKVIDNISLNIPKDQIISIAGPSGCGKTVLLWLIAGFIVPTQGKISINKKIITKPDPSCLMIFQDYVLFPWRNVLENITAALKSTKLSDKEKINEATKALKSVGLERFADWPIYKLSGGMQQRVSLARAVALKSKIWLLDEPFSAIDSYHRSILHKLIIDLQKQNRSTIIIVTHSISEAIKLSNQVIILSARPAQILKIINTNYLTDSKTNKFQTIREQILKILKNESKRMLEKNIINLEREKL